MNGLLRALRNEPGSGGTDQGLPGPDKTDQGLQRSVEAGRHRVVWSDESCVRKRAAHMFVCGQRGP